MYEFDLNYLDEILGKCQDFLAQPKWQSVVINGGHDLFRYFQNYSRAEISFIVWHISL